LVAVAIEHRDIGDAIFRARGTEYFAADLIQIQIGQIQILLVQQSSFFLIRQIIGEQATHALVLEKIQDRVSIELRRGRDYIGSIGIELPDVASRSDAETGILFPGIALLALFQPIGNLLDVGALQLPHFAMLGAVKQFSAGDKRHLQSRSGIAEIFDDRRIATFSGVASGALARL